MDKWDHQAHCIVFETVPNSAPTTGKCRENLVNAIAAARQLGRYGVGCELNPAYAELARVRIGKAEKPHTFVDTREPEEGGLFK